MSKLRMPSKALLALLVGSAILALALFPLAVGWAQPSKPTPQTDVVSGTDAALAKIHPKLRAKLDLSTGKRALASVAATREVEIVAYVKAGTDISKYMTWSLTRPFVDPLGRQAVIGAIKATNLMKLASLSEVAVIRPLESVVDVPKPIDDSLGRSRADIQRRKAAFKAALRASGGRQPTGWWDVGPGHKSSAAWDKGFTGEGVKVMVNDSSTDFAHPDLQGTWAVVTDPDSPYYGWPEMFDSWSMLLYVLDANLGTTYIASGLADYADTSTVCVADEPCVFQPIGATEPHTYTLTGTSVSGEYHIGSHPDKALADMVNGDWDGVAEGEERVAVLVVDENEAGVYDTVYVDLNGNFDFTDDKPVTRDDPIAWADVWDAFTVDPETGEPGVPGQDGYADVSGGLVYFIADGVNPIPASDWMWGDLAPPPANGSLVAFVVQDYTEPAGDHGQLTASNVVGQGVIDGGAPPWKPPGDGTPFTGMVQAAGRDVKITVNGNFYISPFLEDPFLFSALGYDGVPGTEDDIQIISNSWGSSGTHNDGWDEESRLIDAIVRLVNPTLSVLVSTGNGAAAYGTVTSPNGPNIIGVGASTQYGSTGVFDSITSTEQINWGDVMSWSNRGPGARGDNSVHVTANGAWGAGDLSLNEWGDGWTAWTLWGGTSRSAPVAAGNLALVYQAYKEATGEWPDYATARAILMAGADNQHYDTLVQGAGSVNADRATDIAAGLGGVYAMPDNWTVGDYRGAEYPGFTNIIHPGESSSKAFTLYNLSTTTAEVSLSSDRLVKIGEYSFEFTSKDQSLEEGSFTKPDYIFWITDQIPEGTDLMEVKVVFPWAEWDPEYTYEIQQRWRVHVQDWMDVNGDGNLWEDLNGDGVVNADEIDPGEYIRLTYGYNSGTALQARVKRPLERMHDGIFISLRHRNRTEDIPVTHMKIQVNFYQHASWDWLTLSEGSVSVPPGGTATFTATVSVPEDAPYGVYNGAILVDQMRTTRVTGFASFRDENALNDKLVVSYSGVKLPDDRHVYEGWLVNDDGSVKTSVGILPVDVGGNVDYSWVSPTGENLAATYSQFVVTIEPRYDPDPEPSGTVAWSDAIAGGVMTHIRHLLASWPAAPEGKGLAVGLREQAGLALQHAQLAQAAADAGDLDGAKAHAQHVINIIEGETGANFSGVNPGDGWGILPTDDDPHRGYARGVYSHAGFAAGVEGASDSVKLHAGHVQIAATNAITFATAARDLALQVLAAETITDAVSLVDEMVTQADYLLRGNGAAPAPGQGAAETAYLHAQNMAWFLTDADVEVVETSVIPVVANVAANSTDFTFGGTPPADTPYDNGRVFGYFDWAWRAESGDWRFFFTDLPDDIPEGTMLLIDTQWVNPETDIDTLVMGPTEDCFSNGVGCSGVVQNFPGDPDYYGPYTLDILEGSSANTYLGSGRYRWQTNTGGPREIVAVDARPGLNLIALHNVLYAGADTSEPFTGTVGTIRVAPRPIEITTDQDTGSVQVTVQSSLALDALAAEGWGLSLPEIFPNQVARQDDPGDPATASYTRTVTVEHAALLEVFTGNSPGNDLDLYVYDPDGNLVGSSTTPTDEEHVAVEFPRDGVWTIAVHGWSVPAGTATFDLTVNLVQGFDLTVSDLPAGPFAPNEVITFKLNFERAMRPGETWQGMLTLGPTIAPGVVKVPVTIHRVAPPPPTGRYGLSARVFVDARCDTFFTNGLDRALPDVPVTIQFTSGAVLTATTNADGFVSFTGFDVPDAVTVEVQLPDEYRGRTLAACTNSPTSFTLTPADFGPFRFKFLTFRAKVTGEVSGP